MIFPKNIFLFFLCDHRGMAYYLDNGLVNLVNLSSGADVSLKESPLEWMEQELSWSRNTHYFGYNRAYSPELTFVKDSATIIRSLYYKGRGMDQSVFFIATKWNPLTGAYELYYRAELDFSQIKNDDPMVGITVATMEGGLLKLIKAFEKTIYEIPLDGSISENHSVKINGLMFKTEIIYEVSAFPIVSTGSVLPMFIKQITGNDVGIEKSKQDYKSFDYNSPSESAIYTSGNYFFASIYPILTSNEAQGGFRIHGSLSIGGGISSGKLYVMFSDGNKTDITSEGGITSGTLYFDKTISILAGVNAYLCFYSTSNVNINGGTIYCEFNSQFEDTFAYVIKPKDALALILQKICGSASDEYSIAYKSESSVLNQYQNIALTSGSALRGENGAVLKISLSSLFDSYNPILCASLGVEREDGVETLFFESRKYVYDPSRIDIELGEIARMKILPATDMMCDHIKIGYKEQKYDFKQGNDEINTTSQYRTPLKRIQKDLSLVCEGRGDSFGIESTRFLIGSTNTSNNKSDNDIFLINTDFTSPSNVELNILTNVRSASVTSLKYHDKNVKILTGTDGIYPILKWPIEITTINGTALKDSFGIVNESVPDGINSTILQYNGVSIINNSNSNVILKGNALFEGRIDGILKSVLGYLYTTSTGTFDFVFTLRKNNTEVTKIISKITLGVDFKVNLDFSNVGVSFGDTLRVDWEIAWGKVIKGDSYNTYYYTVIDQFPILPHGVIGTFSNVQMNLSSADSEEVYSLKRATYDSVDAGDMLNPKWIYNVEDMTPSRMLFKNGSWIRSLFYNVPHEFLRFQTMDKHHKLSTVKGSKAYNEGSDILISQLGDLMFYPFYFEIDTQIPETFMKLMNESENAHAHFTYWGVDFYGFPVDMKVKPALNESQTWKLLASPQNTLNNLINIDISGFTLLNLQTMGTFISHLNPVKFVEMGKTFDARYNFRHMDEDWFINQVDFWIQKKSYYQKWQQNDTISIQIVSNAISPAKILVYDSNAEVVLTVSMVQKTDPSIIPPLMLFQSDINLSILSEGVYYLVVECGVGATMNKFISEGIHVKSKWDRTILFEYSNSFNRLNTIFTTNYRPSFRVEGWISGFNAKSHLTEFEDQPGNMRVINSIPFGTRKLNIGSSYGIPPYVLRLVNMIIDLDSVKIDGLGFSKASQDAEWENIDVNSWPLGYNSIEIRENENEMGISAITEGSIEEQLIVTYQVNISGFGDATEPTIVPIKKVE